MTTELRLYDPAPLDPHQARTNLLVAIWLLSQLGAANRSGPAPSSSRPPPPPVPGARPHPARRRRTVRPPRAC